MSTLLLSRSVVSTFLEGLPLLQVLRDAFARHGRLREAAEDDSLETTGGLWVLSAPGMSAPLCVMHAVQLERLVDALVGALAVDAFARADASRVALLHASDSAGVQLKSLRMVRTLSHLRIYEPEPTRRELLAARLHAELSIPTRSALEAEEAVADADIVLISEACDVDLPPGALRQGAHVNAARSADERRTGVSDRLLDPSTVVSADALARALGDSAPARANRDAVSVFRAETPAFARAAAARWVFDAAKGDETLPRVTFEE
jgi:ornithine cyclodeaminase